MEIYIDKAQKKAVIVADSYELDKLQNAALRTTSFWYKKSNEEENIGEADLDKSIGDKYFEITNQLKKASDQLEEKED